MLDLVATAELDIFRGTRRTRLRVTKLAAGQTPTKIPSVRRALTPPHRSAPGSAPAAERSFGSFCRAGNLRRALLLIIAIVPSSPSNGGGLSLDRIFQQVAPTDRRNRSIPRAASTTSKSTLLRCSRTTCPKSEMTAPGEPLRG